MGNIPKAPQSLQHPISFIYSNMAPNNGTARSYSALPLSGVAFYIMILSQILRGDNTCLCVNTA